MCMFGYCKHSLYQKPKTGEDFGRQRLSLKHQARYGDTILAILKGSEIPEQSVLHGKSLSHGGQGRGNNYGKIVA